MRSVLLACAAAVLCVAPCLAALPACRGAEFPYEGEGPFVQIPAQLAGGTVAGAAGMGLALAFFPADLASDAVHGAPRDRVWPPYSRAGFCGGMYLGKGVAWVAGAPFWLLKKAFWDGPRSLAGKST